MRAEQIGVPLERAILGHTMALAEPEAAELERESVDLEVQADRDAGQTITIEAFLPTQTLWRSRVVQVQHQEKLYLSIKKSMLMAELVETEETR